MSRAGSCAFSKASPMRLRRPVLSSARKNPIQMQIRHVSKFDSFAEFPIPPSKEKFVPTSGTYPKGFRIGSINVGIEPATKSQPDLVLLASDIPSNGAAVFSDSKWRESAPSIIVSKEIVKRTKGEGLRGVIASSWCSNLFAREKGPEDSLRMSTEASKYVSGNKYTEADSSMLVMHTGWFGERPR